MLDFSSKVFIVTGASSGIGKSCAEQIIEMGGKVVGVDNADGAIDSSDYGHFQLSVTDENGMIFITGLRVGEYVISEVANEANEQYDLPADVTVTVYADRTVVAKFYNELIPTDIPYTGDGTNIAFWGAATLGALAGAIVSALFTFLKKEENKTSGSDEE